MITSLALFSSTRVVTWLRPNLRFMGLVPLAFLFSAALRRRAFFSCLVSGLYLLRSLMSLAAWLASTVWVNWLMVGGTLRRWSKMRFCLWMRTYLGHLTKRVRSLGFTISPPIR